MALYLTLIELGWLLAAGSGMLWLRENPGRRMRDSPKPSWRSSTLLVAAVGAGAYGGSGLQTRYHHWGWWVVPAVYVPLFLIGIAAPILTRRWQVRHAAPQPVGLDSSAGTSPTA